MWSHLSVLPVLYLAQARVLPVMVLASGYSHMDGTELRLARTWLEDAGKTIPEVAQLLGRDRSTVRRNLLKGSLGKAKGKVKAVGRPRSVTPKVYRQLKGALDFLLRQSRGEHEVTAQMIKARVGCSLSLRTIRNAFHAEGIWFRRLKEKPILTPQDVAARYAFGVQHERKTQKQWVSSPHAIIDNKHFPMYLNCAGRVHAARRSVRGAYRSGADGLKPHLVKPKGSLKFPAKSVQVTAAVVNGRVRMWHYINGRWGGAAAAAMYTGPLLATLQRAFPARRSWVVMEDNDPAGYQSGLGVEAKRAARLISMPLPKRSPDCNVLDYSLWSQINERMRAQEQSFPGSFRESETAYRRRLRRTALMLPKSIVTKAVGDMRRRMLELVKNKGGLINE